MLTVLTFFKKVKSHGKLLPTKLQSEKGRYRENHNLKEEKPLRKQGQGEAGWKIYIYTDELLEAQQTSLRVKNFRESIILLCVLPTGVPPRFTVNIGEESLPASVDAGESRLKTPEHSVLFKKAYLQEKLLYQSLTYWGFIRAWPTQRKGNIQFQPLPAILSHLKQG